MSGGMEMDPEAVQAFATVLADAKAKFDKVKARFDQSNSVAEDFGRSWHEQGTLFVNSWGKLAPDLGSLSSLLEQIQAQLGQTAELVVTGETAAVGDFTTIKDTDTTGSGDEESPSSSSPPSAASIGGFPLSNAWDAFKGKLADDRTINESFADVIRGPQLDKAVQETAHDYMKRLELGSEFLAMDQRARLLDLNWGKIEHDAGLLSGLGAAVADLSAVLSGGTAKIGETWKGESYEAFRTAVGKITTTLTAYADGAATTGAGLAAAMSNIRDLYQTYAQDTVDQHLNFDYVSPPKNWHKVTGDSDNDYSPWKLAEACCGTVLCDKASAGLALVNTFVTDNQWATCLAAPCENWGVSVQATIQHVAEECANRRAEIGEQIEAFKGITDQAVGPVTEMMDLAVGNLVELAEDEVLSSLAIIGGGGAAPVDGGDYSGGGGPSGGGGGSYPGGGSGGGGGSMPVATPPPTEVPEVPEVAPAAVAPQVDEPADAAAPEPQDTVRIQDGDRAISVSSPDGSGQVRVTVEDATGATKSYSLDFDAASGLLPMGQNPVEAPEPAVGPDGQPIENQVQQIPASTNGKCVIEDGPLTITAERPLFAPDSLRLVVDDGTGEPTTYTVDFADQAERPEAAGLPAMAPGPAPAEAQEIVLPVAEPVAEDVVAEPEEPVAEEPVAEALVTEALVTEALVTEPPAETAVPTQPTASPVDAEQATTPQSEADGTGAMSGRLPEPGSAELGVAADDNGDTAPAAAGMPMLGGTGAQGDSGDSGGRISSGWSVHGDLFDSGEPVYSMHGVLGDDDRDAEQVSR